MQPSKIRPSLRAFTVAVLAATFATGQEDPYLEDLRSAERYAEKGRRARARSIFEEILDDAEDFGVGGEGPSARVVASARRGLLELEFIAGEYARVIDEIGGLPKAERSDPDLRWLVAESNARRGEYDAAKKELRAWIEALPGDVRAGCRLGELLAETGDRGAALEAWDGVIETSRRNAVRDPLELSWVARAHINKRTRADFEQASALLVDAIRRAPDLAEPRIQLGWLRFLAYGEAAGFEHGETVIKRVLEVNGDVEEALVTLFRIRASNNWLNASKTTELLDRALAVNPNSVDAKLLKGIRLIDDRRFEEGARMLDGALATNPNDKRVLAQRAAVAHLRGRPDDEKSYRARALAIDDEFIGVDVALGDRLVSLYRFADAIEPYERAYERQPDSIEVLQGFAKACVYAGQGERADKLLARAAGLQEGLVDPWRHNIIAIGEQLANEYDRIETEGFVFRIHKDDRAVLEEYLIPFHQEARRVLGEKYGHVPPDPVTIEVLHTWDDFSVRTTGFRGFSALGACFGPLVTLVSPGDNDLRKNDFMWTATVWHEYAHVLTLALSKSRVPRWLTEGFSVYEERAQNLAWERGMVRDCLDAYHNRQIPPVRLLNRLFRGPRILFGYYQGGLTVGYLAREFGFDKVLEMLRLYGEDLSQEEIFKRSFGIDTREFDARFLAYIEAEVLKGLKIVPRLDGRAIARVRDELARNPKDVESHLKLAWAMLQRDVLVDAADHLRRVFKLDPDNATAKLIHGNLLKRRGRFDESAAAYEQGFAAGADDFDSRVDYGLLLESREDFDGAARQYLAAKACWPRCTDQKLAPPILLAKLYNKLDRRTEAMMELKMFCRLTARAFKPRLTLAQWEHEAGHFESEAKLLDEAVQIDPFVRAVHVRLARAFVEIDRKQDAVRELRVALSVDPAMDRDNIGKENPITADSPEHRRRQAEVCVELAKLLKQLGNVESGLEYLERAKREAPDSDAAAEADDLTELWR